MPSNEVIWTFHQPDGTPFQARVVGDEYFAFYETPDGSVIEQDAQSRNWYYAKPKADGALQRTDRLVGGPLPKGLDIDQEKEAWLEVNTQSAAQKADVQAARGSEIPKAASSGFVKGVMLFANFSDTTTTFTDADLGNLLNTTGYNSNGALGSVRDYFYENSYATFTLQMDVFSCTLPQTRAWYGHNTAGAGTDALPREMIADAIAAANGTVNFADYDADGDGAVDVFGVIHQGQGEESGGGPDAIWSHSSNLASAVTVDGKTIREYFTVPERFGATSLATIGVYCHEMGHHMFNLPDLYDLDGGSYGVGSWSLMGYGGWLGPNGAKPCHLDPWCKRVLGWITPTTITSAQSGVALPNYDENPVALLVPIDPYQDGEFFLVCNRYKRATAAAATGFDEYLPGSGALIMHIDDYVRDNKVETLKKVDIEEADGNNHLDNQANLGDAGDLYPNGASTFNDTSAPNTRANDGTGTGIVLESFSGAGTANMTCSVTPQSSPSGTTISYDLMGSGGSGYGFDGIDYGVVRFTAAYNGILERVKTYFTFSGTTNYTIYVYSGWSGGAPAGLLTSQSGSHAGRGQEEIPLVSPQFFAAGEDFYVQIKYDSGFFYPLVVPIEMDGQCSGRGWVSNDGVTYTNVTLANGLPYDLNIRANLKTGPTADAITPTTPSPTNGNTVEFTVQFSADVQNFNDVSDLVIVESGTVSHTGASISGGPQTFTVSITGVTGDGTLALEVSTTSDVEGTTGNALTFSVTSAAVTVDHIAPDAPNVDGATPTGDTTPTWTWTPTSGGNGNYRYKLDDSDLSTGATLTTETSYTPASALTVTIHTLYVQERDDAGNWSLSGSFAITIDTSGLYPPIVSGVTPTNDTTPTWSWVSSGGIGTGTFRYQLDSESGAWTTTVGTSHTPSTALPEGSHTLYVQEEDGPSNWSASGSFTLMIDTTAPSAPIVSGTTPTNDTTPTWTWASTGGGNGNYRYQMNSEAGAWTATVGTSYTPGTALPEGSHTLYVQEEDEPSNWSASGSFTLMIDTTAPSAPIVSGTTPTNDTTPTWTWASTGGGNGNYRYQLNSEAGPWTATAGTAYTPATPLTEATHVLYVQEQDDAGNWSTSGNFAITVDTSYFPPGISALIVPKFTE